MPSRSVPPQSGWTRRSTLVVLPAAMVTGRAARTVADARPRSVCGTAELIRTVREPRLAKWSSRTVCGLAGELVLLGPSSISQASTGGLDSSRSAAAVRARLPPTCQPTAAATTAMATTAQSRRIGRMPSRSSCSRKGTRGGRGSASGSRLSSPRSNSTTEGWSSMVISTVSHTTTPRQGRGVVIPRRPGYQSSSASSQWGEPATTGPLGDCLCVGTCLPCGLVPARPSSNRLPPVYSRSASMGRLERPFSEVGPRPAYGDG